MNEKNLNDLNLIAKSHSGSKINPAELAANSKLFPYFGYVAIRISNCPEFLMFSNNDDFVAKTYFWLGPDSYESMTLKLWLTLSKSAHCIFDVGSYTGLFSLSAAAANPKSKIIAFEALDRNYLRFINNKAVNGFGNITIINKAVSNSNLDIEFNVYSGDDILVTGSSLIQKSTSRPIFVKKNVQAITLDDYLIVNPNAQASLIKIDAEGAEHLVLEGGAQYLRTYKPDIILEILEGSNLDYLNNTLTALGYRYFLIQDDIGKLVELSSLRTSSNMQDLNTLITLKSKSDLATLGINIA